MTIGEWIEMADARLKAVRSESPRLEAQLLAAHVEGQSRSWVIAHPDLPFNEIAGEALLQRREAREPIAYILGYREFFGRRFEVGKGVFIPRQETEILIDAVVELAKDFPSIRTALDICSGSGCNGITIALETKLKVVSADISMQAIDYIARNAHALGAEIEIRQSDRFSGVADLRFDLIVANPPYIKTEAVLPSEIHDYEPETALFGGEDGLDGYRWLASESEAIAAPGAWMLVEVGNGMEDQVREVFEVQGWEFLRSLRDLSNVERVLGFRRRV